MRHTCLTLLVLSMGCSGCNLFRVNSLTESAPMVIPSSTARHQVAGQVGYGGKRGFDGSVSYALTNHVALSGTVFVNRQQFHDSALPGVAGGYDMAVDSRYAEGQVAWYWVKQESLVWALAGGYGSGSRRLNWLENHLDATYNRYSVQASRYWVSSGKRSTGIGIKLHYTDYLSASSQQAGSTPYRLTGTPRGIFGVDIAQTVRFPLSPVLSLSGQAGWYISTGNIQMTGSNGTDGHSNAGLIATVGLSLSLPGHR